MSEYIPGPWRVNGEDEMQGWHFITVMADGYRIAEIQPNDEPEFNGRLTAKDWANARLIAAAPDLFKALYRLIDVVEFAYMNAPELPKEIAEARAAIAKASAE